MHTVELLEEALEVARQIGYQVRHEWLGAHGGGACEFAGRKWMFVDLALNAIEQLDQVTDSLRRDPAVYGVATSAELGELLGVRRAA